MIAVEDKDLEALLVCARMVRDQYAERLKAAQYTGIETAAKLVKVSDLVIRVEESRARK